VYRNYWYLVPTYLDDEFEHQTNLKRCQCFSRLEECQRRTNRQWTVRVYMRECVEISTPHVADRPSAVWGLRMRFKGRCNVSAATPWP